MDIYWETALITMGNKFTLKIMFFLLISLLTILCGGNNSVLMK